MDFTAAKDFIIHKFQSELSPSLYYHSIQHTLGVWDHVKMIGKAEGVKASEMLLLETAALYHDAGFLLTYKEHEAAGCRIVAQKLPGFGYARKEIDIICGMIMATKIPQSPDSHLEEILCDADLYYLGQSDFHATGNLLYREFMEHGIVKNEQEWNKLQVQFLESHNYFTQTAILHCKDQKRRHLREIKQIVATYMV